MGPLPLKSLNFPQAHHYGCFMFSVKLPSLVHTVLLIIPLTHSPAAHVVCKKINIFIINIFRLFYSRNSVVSCEDTHVSTHLHYPFRGSDFETSMQFTFLYLAHFSKSLWHLCFSVVILLLGAVLSTYNGLLIGLPISILCARIRVMH